VSARDISEVHARRQRYWQNGYRPIAIWNPNQTVTDAGEKLNSPGKQPRGPGWLKRALQDPPEAVRLRPDPRALNTGLACERIVGADVDVPVQALADQIVNLAEVAFDATPLVRIGLAPKALLVYRSVAAFSKIQTPEMFLPDGTKCKVELLAKGQQFVCDGIHPDTLKPYRWTGETPETVRLDDLPAIDEEQARAFIEDAERLLRAAGAKEKAKPQRHERTDPGQGGKFFGEVNRRCLADIQAWVGAIFPRARFEPGTGAWRVSSVDLNRHLEEDLSVHPDGVQDFGEEEPLTPIDLVLRYAAVSTPLDAALWLCDRLSVDPASLGYRKRKKREDEPPLDEDWPEPAQLFDPKPTPSFPTNFLPGALGEFAAQQAFDLQVPPDLSLAITTATKHNIRIIFVLKDLLMVQLAFAIPKTAPNSTLSGSLCLPAEFCKTTLCGIPKIKPRGACILSKSGD
jgi:hypothetical protein